MKPIFTEEELKLAKSETLLPIECKECGKTFYKTKHYIKSRILNPKQRPTGDYCSNACSNAKKKNKIINKICPKCHAEFETISGKNEKRFCSSFCAHSRKQTEETKINISNSNKNSDKVKLSILKRTMTDEKLIKKTCPICEKEFKVYPSEYHRIYCSRKCCNNDVNFNYKKKSPGGIREGSGRSKSGWYSGYYCNSSYELAWVIYHLDHNIKFERNKEGFEYIINNEKHKYYPDFIIDDVYYEIKGFLRFNDRFKFEYFPNKLTLMLREDLKYIFDYVISKYGKSFIELYNTKISR